MHEITSNWTWTLITVKSTLYTLNTPEAQILVRFTVRLSVSEIQGCQISEMYRMAPNWTWTLNSQKYSIYTLNTYRWGPNFVLPHWLPYETVKKKKRTKKKKIEEEQKFNILNFSILVATLVEALPRSIHEFKGANLVCSFRGDVVWNFYHHMVQC